MFWNHRYFQIDISRFVVVRIILHGSFSLGLKNSIWVYHAFFNDHIIHGIVLHMIWVLTAWFGLILLKHQSHSRQHFPLIPTPCRPWPVLADTTRLPRLAIGCPVQNYKKLLFYILGHPWDNSGLADIRDWTPYSPVKTIPKMQSLGFSCQKLQNVLLFRLKWHRFIPLFRVAKLAVLVANWTYEGKHPLYN